MRTYFLAFFYPLPKYITEFVKNNFQLNTYLLVAAFLATCIGINYWLSFETQYVATANSTARFIHYILFYGFAYYGGVFILWVTKKETLFIFNPNFWWYSFLGLLIISFDGSFNGAYVLAKELVDAKSYVFVGGLISEFKNFITIIIPLLLIWVFTKKHHDSFFGLTTKEVLVKPYLRLLLVMIPLILVAAQTASFLHTYPTFKSYGTNTYWGVSIGWLVMAYEFLYASAFLAVELFFRGFLVIGLARLMGKNAVLPMVCMYAFLHFEKPMGEAISSIIGGYLLGSFAYYSKNIWGGVFVHAGIALLMELAAGIMKI